jgi:SAM-dependent methyltransferase
VRDESREGSYEADLYDSDLLEHLYPRYLDAFREKRNRYRDLLPFRAEVVELGSHLGAFLQAAEEWSWRPTGVDIGAYTSLFSEHRGLRVKREPFEDVRLPRHSADAVCVWNCFEQLEHPAETLETAYALLKRHGLLILRIPNFGFYETWQRLARVRAFKHSAFRSLAYNNLLGFPYLNGYSPSLLNSIVARHGFIAVAGSDTTLVTMPFPDVSAKVREELKAAYRPYRNATLTSPWTVSGPWVEMAYRRREN